jgi:hypothetical protein
MDHHEFDWDNQDLRYLSFEVTGKAGAGHYLPKFKLLIDIEIRQSCPYGRGRYSIQSLLVLNRILHLQRVTVGDSVEIPTIQISVRFDSHATYQYRPGEESHSLLTSPNWLETSTGSPVCHST